MTALHARELAKRQLELDRLATERFPPLLAKKRARMFTSPHAFLRGSAPLFYEILAARDDLAGPKSGEGWIVGDMHLENMGAYKSDDGTIVFDLNDFDDVAIAPRRWDALRLSTSVILCARAQAIAAPECVAVAQRLLEVYADTASGERMSEPPPMASPMLAIVEAALKRSKKDLLDARAPVDRGRRRFVRGDRYLDLTPELRSLAERLLPRFVQLLGSRAPARASSWKIEDVAQRVAGTGSLGRLRFAILVKDDHDDERILDFKESAPSSGDRARAPDGAPSPADHASRVVSGANQLVPRPPKLLTAIPSGDMSFIGRQLCPQEDKLDVSKIGSARMLGQIAERAGFIAGSAHARAGWTGAKEKIDRSALLDAAIELAGAYEAIYLAYARLM